jgi:TonB family protein
MPTFQVGPRNHFTERTFRVLISTLAMLFAAPVAAEKTPALPPLESCYDGPIDREKKDVPPRLLNTVNPDYTEAARKEKIQGVVRVEIVVTPQGKPCPVKVVRGLRPELDRNAVKAVEKWMFEPAQREGKPVASRIVVEVSFRLY